jgi:hypothetical protein
MSRSERWTVAAGRQILFDGQPFIGINREGNAEPVEADSVTHFIAQCLNQAAMTPDELYRRHMGYARRRRTSEVHAPATRSAHAPPSSRAATGWIEMDDRTNYRVLDDGDVRVSSTDDVTAEDEAAIAASLGHRLGGEWFRATDWSSASGENDITARWTRYGAHSGPTRRRR